MALHYVKLLGRSIQDEYTGAPMTEILDTFLFDYQELLTEKHILDLVGDMYPSITKIDIKRQS
jgi:hypothetical protein